MAFADGTLNRLSGANSDAGVIFTYSEAATLAAIRASAYFDDSVNEGMGDGDIVIIFGSDGFGLSLISVSGSTYTVGEGITSA